MSKLIPLQNPFRAKTGATYSLPGFVTPPQASQSQGTVTPTATDGATPLAGMLLAAVVAAMLVVADQVISTWADGQLLVGWVGLWVVTFALLSYLAPSMRQLAGMGTGIAQRWAGRRAAQRADERLWSLAMQDHRLLGELQAAQMRDQGDDE